MGPATGLSCLLSLVADGPLEADALLALEEALRVDLLLDRLELRDDGRGLDGRLPLVRRYVRGTSPLPSPPALRRRTYCTSDAHNVCINPLVTRSSIMLDSTTREKSHNPGGRTPP